MLPKALEIVLNFWKFMQIQDQSEGENFTICYFLTIKNGIPSSRLAAKVR
jgi:hypothetical protein